jgi:hypothetical protein
MLKNVFQIIEYKDGEINVLNAKIKELELEIFKKQII